MVFERRLEENLLDLREKLESGSYRPGRFVAFLVERPKQREIFAADFRDRVVHHLLVEHLERWWERRFIHDSFACRRGKGIHAGVERGHSFTRSVTGNGTRPAWYLQLDVSGFFVAIDRSVLWERLASAGRDPVLAAEEDALEVDRKRPLPDLLGGGDRVAILGREDAGVVEQHVERAEAALRCQQLNGAERLPEAAGGPS